VVVAGFDDIAAASFLNPSGRRWSGKAALAGFELEHREAAPRRRTVMPDRT